MVKLIEQGLGQSESVDYTSNEKMRIRDEVKNKQIAKLEDALRKR